MPTKVTPYLNTRRTNCREVFMSLCYIQGVFSFVLPYGEENMVIFLFIIILMVIFTSSFMSVLPLPPMLKSITSISSQFCYQTYRLSCSKFLFFICKQNSGQ